MLRSNAFFCKDARSSEGISNPSLSETFALLSPTLIFTAFYNVYFPTVTLVPSECEVNSGAYMHWMVVRPLL